VKRSSIRCFFLSVENLPFLCAVGFTLPGNGSLNILRFRLSTKKEAYLGIPARSSVIGDTLNKVSRLGIENE